MDISRSTGPAKDVYAEELGQRILSSLPERTRGIILYDYKYSQLIRAQGE